MSNFTDKLIGRLKLNSPENREKLRQRLPIEFPAELANPFIDYMLERSYLDEISERDSFFCRNTSGAIRWIQIVRLPVHPNEKETYDLLSRWQSVLSSLHSWDERFIFLLQRKIGVTNLYIGLQARYAGQVAVSKLETVLINCMPGISLKRLSRDESVSVWTELGPLKHAGAITGIPSFRKAVRFDELQTLDSLAFGIRDAEARDADFSLLVIADPINDAGITEIISKFQELGTNIHRDVHKTYGAQDGVNKTRDVSVGLQTLMLTFNAIIGAAAETVTGIAGGTGVRFSNSISYSVSESTDFLNKFAEYSEKATDLHCNRLRKGRNQGFWNAGVYVLSNSETNVSTLLGMLRSVYSGDESYIEPIRIHKFKKGSGAEDIIRSFSLIPLAYGEQENTNWHIFGPSFQYVSTPVNTQELSLFTSLPRKDVPGLRFVKTAVRFANNPGTLSGDEHLKIGTIKDYGLEQKTDYILDINALVRHSLIVGSTGSGKSTTCRKLIENVLARKRAVLIIEPAKEEYVRWAIEMKKAGMPINLFMPGVKTFEGERIEQLKLNPFQPAAIQGADIDMMTRCEQFTSLVNASLPASDVLPIIIDETFYVYLKNQQFGGDFMRGEMPQLAEYPKIEGAIETARQVLKSRGYTDEVSQGIGAAVETRLTYLSRGKRGEILNVRQSTSWRKLFDETTVINLSRLANPKDRSLIMSLILLALQEYRVSKYANDEAYRRAVSSSSSDKLTKLMHLTVVEEAHNVLSVPNADNQGAGNPQQVVADLFSNMLSEIRAYGEGLMIVDQSPTKLIGDAIKNTNYKIAHRLISKDDCAVMDSALALRNDQSGILPALETGDAIIYGDRDDAASWIKVAKSKIDELL